MNLHFGRTPWSWREDVRWCPVGFRYLSLCLASHLPIYRQLVLHSHRTEPSAHHYTLHPLKSRSWLDLWKIHHIITVYFPSDLLLGCRPSENGCECFKPLLPFSRRRDWRLLFPLHINTGLALPFVNVSSAKLLIGRCLMKYHGWTLGSLSCL